jgi:hypothetical protein
MSGSARSRSRRGTAVAATGRHDHTHTVGRRACGRTGPGLPTPRTGGPGTRGTGGEEAPGKEAPGAAMGAAWAHALFVRLEDGNAHRYIEGQRRCVLLLRLQASARAPAGVRLYAEVREGGRGRAGGVGTRLRPPGRPKRIRSGMERLIEQERAIHVGDPEREAEAWAWKIAECDRRRCAYQDQ